MAAAVAVECTSEDGDAVAGNWLENPLPEFQTVALSRCVGCEDVSKSLSFPGIVFFLILKYPKNRRAPSKVNKVDGAFL
jgi:hypothetical protein